MSTEAVVYRQLLDTTHEDKTLLDGVVQLILTELAGDRDEEARHEIEQRVCGRTTVVATSPDGHILATGALRVLDTTHALIEDVVTMPSERNRGIGTKVVKLIEETATRSAGSVELEVFPLAGSENFYANLGYREVGGKFSKLLET